MKVLYTENAKATWIFDLRLLNPRGMKITTLMEAIIERYKFSKFPASPLDVKEGGLSFVEGEFTNSTGFKMGVSVTVYGDGIVADTFCHTDNTTEFLRDLALFSGDLGFPFPNEGEIGKAFTSILGVATDAPLLILNPKIERIARLIENTIVTMDGKPRVFEFAGIRILSEDIGQNKAPAMFTFERKAGQPFSSDRYWTQAPLETDAHIAVLEELEALLSV